MSGAFNTDIRGCFQVLSQSISLQDEPGLPGRFFHHPIDQGIALSGLDELLRRGTRPTVQQKNPARFWIQSRSR
jgi:hypothetical protein